MELQFTRSTDKIKFKHLKSKHPMGHLTNLTFFYARFCSRSVSFRVPNQPASDLGDKEDEEFLPLPGSQFGSRQSSPQRPVRSRQGYDERDVCDEIEAEFDLPSTGRRRLYPAFSEDDASSTNSADVVAEAKYRLKSLEREAQVLKNRTMLDSGLKYSIYGLILGEDHLPIHRIMLS